jgi:hypothetical protein
MKLATSENQTFRNLIDRQSERPRLLGVARNQSAADWSGEGKRWRGQRMRRTVPRNRYV